MERRNFDTRVGPIVDPHTAPCWAGADMPPLKPLTDAAARVLRPKADRYDVPDGRVPGLVLSVLRPGCSNGPFVTGLRESAAA
jgi:hypothetical protein